MHPVKILLDALLSPSLFLSTSFFSVPAAEPHHRIATVCQRHTLKNDICLFEGSLQSRKKMCFWRQHIWWLIIQKGSDWARLQTVGGLFCMLPLAAAAVLNMVAIRTMRHRNVGLSSHSPSPPIQPPRTHAHLERTEIEPHPSEN